MKNKLFRLTSIVMALMLVFGMTTLAFADDFTVDNDIYTNGLQNSVSLSAVPGAEVSTSAQIVVDWQGQKHLVAGSSITFSVNQTNLPSNSTVGNASGTVPLNWNDTDDIFGLPSAISFTAPATPGNYTYTVKWMDTATTCQSSGCLSGGGSAFTINLTVTAPPVVDQDGDGIPDASDNCPTVANANQANADGDSLGNACDPNGYAPVVKTAASDVTGFEGGTLVTSGAFSDQDADATLTITKVSGVGTVTDNGSGNWSWSLATTDNGAGTVVVQASDGEHAVVTDSFAWSAANVAPTAIFAYNTPVNEGSPFTLSLTNPVDPSSADVAAGFTYAFDCGDGAGYGSFSASYTVSCPTTDNGTRAVKAKIQDKDGGVSEYAGTVIVNNVAPTGVFGDNGPVVEGSPFTLSMTGADDPSSVDTSAGFTYAFDCGDGAGYGSFGATDSASCSTVDNGTRSVGGKIQDKDGGVSEYAGTVTISNAAPTVSALTIGGGSTTACMAGNAVTLDFGFSDPGSIDFPWSVVINWGDGTQSTYTTSLQGVQPQLAHTYAAGTYAVSVSVTDKDGGTGLNSSASGAVSLLYNMTGILQPFNANGTSVWKYGSTLPVKVIITDCDAKPVPGLAPKVGTSLVSSSDPTISIDEVASTSAADTTGIMRYAAADGQYIYNFGTKNLLDPSALYYMTVKGTDASGKIVTSPAMVQVKFGLKLK